MLLRVHASNRARARGWTRAQRAETVVHVVFEEEPNRRNAIWSCEMGEYGVVCVLVKLAVESVGFLVYTAA